MTPAAGDPRQPPDPLAVHHGLAVYRIGDGPPIMLMPGPHRFQQPGDGSAGALIAGLTGIGRRVVSFDPPGSGRSSRPARLSMAEMHDCADETLGACGLSPPVDVVGHSMGGLVALAYAIERPARVRRLVLIATGTGGRAYMTAPGALWNRSHPRFWRLAFLGVLQLAWHRRAPEAMINDFIRRESFVDRRFFAPTELGWRDWFRPRRGRTDWHRIARHLDYGPRLAEVAVATLILCGRRDPQYPPACSRELGHGIRGSRVVWFEHSGHYPFIEEPEAFWATVAGPWPSPTAR